MKLPFVISDGLNAMHASRWKTQFVQNHRTGLEGLWRRSQEQATKSDSGWKSSKDGRRKMLHYFDEYGLKKTGKGKYAFVLKAPYLWVQVVNPKEEIAAYLQQTARGLEKGNWSFDSSKKRWKRGNLFLVIKQYPLHPQDKKAGRAFPSDYESLEWRLFSSKTKMGKSKQQNPWTVLRSGIRKKGAWHHPMLVNDIRKLTPFIPMQVELGGGPSTEAGVPALHYLHEVYHISDPKTRKFILTPAKDLFWLNLLSNPESFFEKAALMYRNALTCKDTRFYTLLKRMHDEKRIVGAVITNNFDGLCGRMGLREKFVRQYAESKIIPKIRFHPKAKSLLVVGSHADRRRIQQAARNVGLKVIFVDPEGFWSGRKFSPYPLEGIQNDDLLVRMTADTFARKMNRLLDREKRLTARAARGSEE